MKKIARIVAIVSLLGSCVSVWAQEYKTREVLNAPADGYEHLTAAFSSMVDMPIVAAFGFKGYVVNCYLLCGNRC